MNRSIDELVKILKNEHCQIRTNVNCQRKDVYTSARVSTVENLSLSEYIIAKEELCKRDHTNCKKCIGDLNAAKIVLKEKVLPLPILWRRSFTGSVYDCEKAQRRLLQLPLLAVGLEGSVYIAAKSERNIDEIREEIRLKFNKENKHAPRTQTLMSSEELNSLMSVANNEAEKSLLKHAACSAYNLSKREARELYGITRIRKRAIKVSDAAERISEIKSKHNFMAKLEQKSYLLSIGLNVDSYVPDLSSDSEVSEVELSSDNEENACTRAAVQEEDSDKSSKQKEDGFKMQHQGSNSHAFSQETDNVPHLDAYYSIALDTLKEVSFNWFAFVVSLQPEFASAGFSEDILDQFLIDFFAKIPYLGLSDDDITLVEKSRTAYLCSQTARESETFYATVSSSDTSGDESDLENMVAITKKLNRIKDNARKKVKEEIELNRFMRKRVTPSTKTIIKTYPNIGKVIEEFVADCDIGADKWRRTGVYTFSGDIKKTKRVTFSRIQEKLKEHFDREFSYGTVVQLCCARNKRRLSSKRYKGVANVRFQKARKGFNVKYNPDYKWSRSMYKLLSQLQSDGTNMMLLNRDDQAGFRLDSTYTHKSYANLSTTPTLTTRTDFVNKYKAQLQISSYNFSQTKTTSEVCVGVVKATGVQEKNPSQHAADLEIVENMALTRPLFFKELTETHKEVECIRVDGSTDEGPSHHEVQFMWTERHVCKSTKVMLVSTRCSGDSYLNRVELQNGCLSRGHSNLFIPSTLHGSPYGSDGKIDEAKYKNNMTAAVQQYVERVDGTPCMDTKIHLSHGADRSNILIARRQKLLVFLKGNKKDRKSLEQKDPTLFTYFSEIWSVRNNHMDDSLPGKYVFLLKCCSRRGCPHPVCQGKFI